MPPSLLLVCSPVKKKVAAVVDGTSLFQRSQSPQEAITGVGENLQSHIAFFYRKTAGVKFTSPAQPEYSVEVLKGCSKV
jgi:hypothetical protein